MRLIDVTKTFGTHAAVRDLNLEVPAGSIYGFIGPNGSGKTTTIRMILHIFLPDSGKIEVLGTTGTRAANDQIGYLPEERGLYKKMTVERVLSYYAALKGLPSSQSRDQIDQWLARLELSPWRGKKVEALSKGMAQKIQFIAAVLARPKLLILDEPFSGLDPVNLEVLRAAILHLRQEGTTIIFSTHDMSVAEKMCDFIFMIYKGRKVLDGTLQSIQSTHGSETVRLRLRETQCLSEIPGVTLLRDFGQIQEVSFAGDAQGLLESLTRRTRVELFEITRSSLHDVFVRIAGPDQEGKRDE